MVSRASGFSFQTCLPAATACRATSAWAAGMVRLTTSSTSGWAVACAVLPTPGTPYLAACALARSRSRSAQISTCRSGNEVRLRRYSSLIVPQPTTATPTGALTAGSTRPWAASQARLSATAVIMSVAQRSSSTTRHAAGGAAARISATGIRPAPTAVIGSSFVTGPSLTCR